jgi:hypothetical protein
MVRLMGAVKLVDALLGRRCGRQATSDPAEVRGWHAEDGLSRTARRKHRSGHHPVGRTTLGTWSSERRRLKPLQT